MYTTLITAAQLQELQQSGQATLVFDCSFDLARPEAGAQMFADSHLAGAIYADLDRHLSAKGDPQQTGACSGGRHPLPSRAAFAQWLQSVGLEARMQAVVYDRQGSSFCGRLWWMLQWMGHSGVAVLDGGLAAWQAAGGPLGSGPAPRPAQASGFTPSAPVLPVVDAATFLAGLGRSGQTVVDARATPRFKGEVEPLDPVAGHIPGALNRPFGLNLDAQGFFKPAEQLRQEWLALLGQRSADSVVHHCGSGVTAIPNILAMRLAGIGPGALFAGSWSEWCSDPARPVARG